jgi:hypothetical protein
VFGQTTLSVDQNQPIVLKGCDNLKVILIENPSPTYNEFAREKLLIEAARNISGPRLLVALDADEALTANL